MGDTNNRPMYGLSAVFEVAAVVTNSDPTFSSSTAAREVAENTAAGQNVGAVLTASDSDGDTLTYTLEGTTQPPSPSTRPRPPARPRSRPRRA